MKKDPRAVASIVQNPETAEVRIAAPTEGSVDLVAELKDELEAVKVPGGRTLRSRTRWRSSAKAPRRA